MTKGHTVTTTTTTTAAVEMGTVVWGRPVREGKAGARRKGVVLGEMQDNTGVLIVWWFGEGKASMDTTTMAYRRELTVDGDVWNTGSRQARRLAKLANGFSRARVLTAALARHARRMEEIGL